MALLDTHCHLTHERYEEDRAQLLVRSREAGVEGVITIASHLEDATRIAGLLEEGALPGGVWGTAGVHPHEVGALPAAGSDGAREVVARLEALLARPGMVAVGECGLDFHYDFSPRDAQFAWFDLQLAVAERTGLPVVVHCREAESAMIPRVREAGQAGVRGVLHCFPGDLELLEAAMEAGWSVSFTGNVTFRNFRGVESVRQVPPGRYFLETDGPYLAPVPHRGKRNEPALVPLIRDRVAELRGEAPETVAAETTAAARAFFALEASAG